MTFVLKIVYSLFVYLRNKSWKPECVGILVHSTYANILKNRYKKVRKHVGIG
jgi:hypothetical protein